MKARVDRESFLNNYLDEKAIFPIDLISSTYILFVSGDKDEDTYKDIFLGQSLVLAFFSYY